MRVQFKFRKYQGFARSLVELRGQERKALVMRARASRDVLGRFFITCSRPASRDLSIDRREARSSDTIIAHSIEEHPVEIT